MKNTEERQAAQDRAYSEAFHIWINSLSGEERAKLETLHLTTPDVSRKTHKLDDELAMQLASTSDSPWETLTASEEVTEEKSATPKTSRDVGVALAAFCARVRSQPNPLLAFDTLCFATGLMGLEGRTQTELALRHGVTKAAFSRQVVAWLDIFELSPPRGCKSMRQREKILAAALGRPPRLKRPFDFTRPPRRRNRTPDRSSDMTVVFVHGLDLFRRWFKKRCRRLPLRRWSPEALAILQVELTWFARLHEQVAQALERSNSR